MRLADTRRPQQQHCFGIGDKAPGRELADLLLIDRRLSGEVETIKVADKREARQPNAHLDPALVFAGDLAFAKQRQGLADRQLAARRLVDQTVELVADRCQLEPIEHRRQMIVVHHQCPPTKRSYSSSGRSNSGAPMASGSRMSSARGLAPEPTTPA